MFVRQTDVVFQWQIQGSWIQQPISYNKYIFVFELLLFKTFYFVCSSWSDLETVEEQFKSRRISIKI